MTDLHLRKVRRPRAPSNYRVILKIDETEFEIGSIGIVNATGTNRAWQWGNPSRRAIEKSISFRGAFAHQEVALTSAPIRQAR
jgi:hypothetical protein